MAIKMLTQQEIYENKVKETPEPKGSTLSKDEYLALHSSGAYKKNPEKYDAMRKEGQKHEGTLESMLTNLEATTNKLVQSGKAVDSSQTLSQGEGQSNQPVTGIRI